MTYLRNIALAGLTLLMLAGCVERAKRVYFNGKYFPTREKAVSRDAREDFVVTVRRADQGIEEALEAGRHGGSKYCIKNFGTSKIDWTRGPDDPITEEQVQSGSLTLSGSCVTW